MSAMKSVLLLVIVVVSVLSRLVSSQQKLIVFLVDGARWDYIDDPKLKGFSKLMKNGVRAPYVVPVFPSLSYPNYQSITTGLYPENHGFVDNYLYDKERGDFFLMIPNPHSAEPRWWNDAEPLWVTSEKAGRKAALYWWAGCEVDIRGYHPTICEQQRFGPPDKDEKGDYYERVDDVVHMFKSTGKHPSGRLQLVLMYYGGVDYTGHKYGPNSPETKEAMYEVDDILDYMQEKVKKEKMENDVNIMVVSDHGMTDVRKYKSIDLDKFSASIKFQLGTGAVSMIVPEDGMNDKLYDEMKAANIDGLNVYKKQNIPSRFRIKNTYRMTPIYLEAKKKYLIKGLSNGEKVAGGPPDKKVGHHGFDPNDFEDMRSIFVAAGPAFRKNYRTNALNITDLYNVMCSILDIHPQPNSGSWDRAKSMLVREMAEPSVYSSSTQCKLSICTFVSFFCMFTVLCRVIKFDVFL